MSFPRYPKYKDSGVEWLGEVPEHWMIDRLKRSTKTCKNGIWGAEPEGDADDIPCTRVADFDRRSLRVVLENPTVRKVTAQERVGRVLCRGDLLLEKSGGGELQPVGCVVLYDDPQPAVCSNFVARIQLAAQMNSSYWRYVHAAAYAVGLNTRSIKQTSGIQNLDQQQYLDEFAPFPPPDEQKVIGDFLDYECGKIDVLMAEQQRLIELLKEKRQAVISHAVSKGLNPDAPMKSSRIAWLGEVPEHWTVMRMKELSTIISKGTTPTTVGADFTSEGVTFLKAENIAGGVVTIQPEFFISNDTHASLARSNLQEGDVLVVIAGATTGKSAVLNAGVSPANTNQAVSFIRLKDKRFSTYVSHWLATPAVQQSILLSAVQSAQPNLSMEDLGNIPMSVPPVDELCKIVAILDGETSRLDDLTAEASRTMRLLTERRTALISAAVTGKIDVRNYVAAEVA